MFVRSICTAGTALLLAVSTTQADDSMPSAQEVPVIEAHAST